jgi:micrococcal nuclease
MWMGSDVSTADEWVEIAGVAPDSSLSGPRSLSGWTLSIQKDTGEAVIAKFPKDARITSGSYMVISNYTKSASRLNIDPLFTSTSMSLPNTKLLLRLRDAQGLLMDEVDDFVGNPFAGSNPPGGGAKASMERINLLGAGNDTLNWRTATDTKGFDPGLPIFGTPGYPNSVVVSSISSFSSVFSSVASVSSISSSSIASLSSSSNSSQQIHNISSSTPLISSQSSSLSVQNSSSSIQVQPYTELKINEVLPDPKGVDTAEWIEMYNPTLIPVNLSGMTIRVGTSAHRLHGGFSGIVIVPDQYLVIPKSVAGFSLTNNGATVKLESGGVVIDTFIYPSLPEEVSAGRTESGDIIPFCIPTPGQKNQIVPPDPHVVIESGKPVGPAPVTLNLGIEQQSGSLASASCHVDFGDGYQTDSCNPSAHTMKTIGDYSIQIQVKNYCGTTVTRSLTGTVLGNIEGGSSIIPSNLKTINTCIPSAFSGVQLTEFLPNPTGSELEGEWIEIHNNTPQSKSLCGWSVDDGLGGSKPFDLSKYQMTPDSFLVLPRSQTKIALNNDHDSVRLIAPLPAGGTGISLSTQYDIAPANESYAVDDTGNWSWTPFMTPGSENRFQEVTDIFSPSPIQISAALPNPKGVDTYDEWIELTNTAGWPIWLNGWSIHDAHGSVLDLTGMVLSKVETKKILLQRLHYTLANEADTLFLVDPDSAVRSILSWKNAKEDVIEKPYSSTGSTYSALVRQVIDGDTIVVQLDGNAPDHLERVRLLGIDAPELHDKNVSVSNEGVIAKNYIIALLLNKKIDLQFDSIKKDKYGRMLAYVFKDGTDIQQQLLIHGLAYAYREYPVGREDEYAAYEELARSKNIGLWKDQALTAYYDAKIAEQERWRSIQLHGLSLKADIPEGIVASGSSIHFKFSQPAQLYASINNGPYLSISGSLLVASNETIRAYAEADSTDAGSIRSEPIQKTYIVDANAPKHAVRISEVYPSPAKGETEWIELQNKTENDVSVGGWMLDDTASGGSLPWRIPANTEIPAAGYLLFSKQLTGISLNNSGDAARLLDPAGKQLDSLTFGSMKTGRAIAWNEATATTCLTDSPTPLGSNICTIKNKKSTQVKKIKKGIKAKSSNKKNTKKNISNTLKINNEQRGNGSGLYIGLEEQKLGYSGQIFRRITSSTIAAKLVAILMSIFFVIFALWWLLKKIEASTTGHSL